MKKKATKQLKDTSKTKLIVEMHTVLSLIVAEFRSDPMSVQCFDLSIVKRAEAVVKNFSEERMLAGTYKPTLEDLLP